MQGYIGRLFKIAGKLKTALDIVGLGGLTRKGSLLRLLTRDGFLLTEIDHQPTWLWWNFVVSPYEPYMTELFRQAIKPGATVLDVGAHFGYYSFIAAEKVSKEGKVYAFEPAPDNFKVLNRGIQINGYRNISAIQKAVSDRNSTLTFFLSEASTGHGVYPDLLSPTKGIIQVECLAMDEFLGGHTVDVIKMDIQGHELYALHGMTQTIGKSEGLVMFVEWAPAWLRQADIDPSELLEQIQNLGFDVQLIDEEKHCLIPIAIGQLQLLELRNDPSQYVNLYCVKR